MTDKDAKRFENTIKDTIRPLQESVDEMYQTVAGHTKKLDALWDQTVRLTVDMEEVKTAFGKLEGGIDQMDRKLDKVIDTNIDYGNTIKDIEQIPVIAHELKLKKHH